MRRSWSSFVTTTVWTMTVICASSSTAVSLLRSSSSTTDHGDDDDERRSQRRSSTMEGDAPLPDYPYISEELSCYRTVEGSYRTMDRLVSRYPDLASIVPLGPSYLRSVRAGGREMRALVLTDRRTAANDDHTNATETYENNVNANVNATVYEKAPLFVLCSLHARELAPAEVCARFAEHVLAAHDDDADVAEILRTTEIHLVLQANPDGREDEEAALAVGDFRHLRRKNVHEIGPECNDLFGGDAASGTDLNRNFPGPKQGTIGVGRYRCDETWPGTEAASEPETRAIVNHVRRTTKRGGPPNPRDDATMAYSVDLSRGALLDLHSYGEDVFWPFGHELDGRSPNDQALRTLARKVAKRAIPHVGHRYRADNKGYYLVSGDSTDWAYDELGLAALTLELGTDFHEPCDSFETRVWPAARDMLLYAARVTDRPYALPRGPDVERWIEVGTSKDDDDDNGTDLLLLTVAATIVDENFPVASIDLFLDDDDTATRRLVFPDANRHRRVVATFSVPLPSAPPGRRRAVRVRATNEQGRAGPVYARYVDAP